MAVLANRFGTIIIVTSRLKLNEEELKERKIMIFIVFIFDNKVYFYYYYQIYVNIYQTLYFDPYPLSSLLSFSLSDTNGSVGVGFSSVINEGSLFFFFIFRPINNPAPAIIRTRIIMNT